MKKLISITWRPDSLWWKAWATTSLGFLVASCSLLIVISIVVLCVSPNTIMDLYATKTIMTIVALGISIAYIEIVLILRCLKWVNARWINNPPPRQEVLHDLIEIGEDIIRKYNPVAITISIFRGLKWLTMLIAVSVRS